MNYPIHIKRVYEEADDGDGIRILVDRLWPRGKRRSDLSIDDWLGNVAPSSGLRRAWHSKQLDAGAFGDAYLAELAACSDNLIPLMRAARQGTLTLLTATRDPARSHLPVLRRALLAELEKEDREADGREPSSPVCYDR